MPLFTVNGRICFLPTKHSRNIIDFINWVSKMFKYHRSCNATVSFSQFLPYYVKNLGLFISSTWAFFVAVMSRF